MADRRADMYKYIHMYKKDNLIFNSLPSIQVDMASFNTETNNLDLLLGLKDESDRISELVKSNRIRPKDGIILLQNKKAPLKEFLAPWLTQWAETQFRSVAPGVLWENDPHFQSSAFALEDFFPDSNCFLNSLIENAKVDPSLVFKGEKKAEPAVLYKYANYKLGKTKSEYLFWNGRKKHIFDKDLAFKILAELFKKAQDADSDEPKARAIEKNILFKRCDCVNSDLGKIFTSTKNDSLKQIFELIQKYPDKSSKKMYYSL